MGKEKNRIRNLEEEKKIGEASLRKLVEIYSYNTVVDQFFMKTSKKIVEIDKILRNLKNKTGSAFVSKFLYENKNELSKLYKNSTSIKAISDIEEKIPSIRKKFLNHKRTRNKNKRIYLTKTRKGNRFTYSSKNENLNIKENKKRLIENNSSSNENKNKYIFTHLLINQYAHNNSLEYLPNKTIEERLLTMKNNILKLFPELEKDSNSNEKGVSIELEEVKKKEYSSFNESHITKESDNQINLFQ